VRRPLDSFLHHIASHLIHPMKIQRFSWRPGRLRSDSSRLVQLTLPQMNYVA
jgi:hypothetical protein